MSLAPATKPLDRSIDRIHDLAGLAPHLALVTAVVRLAGDTCCSFLATVIPAGLDAADMQARLLTGLSPPPPIGALIDQ